jgi:hypothetical protein
MLQGVHEEGIEPSHGRRPLLAPSFASENIIFLNLYLCRVLDPNGTFVARDETRCQLRLAYARKRCNYHQVKVNVPRPPHPFFFVLFLGVIIF